MKNIKNILLIALVTIVAMACRKTEDPGGTNVQAMCGEWQVYVVEWDGWHDYEEDGPIKLITSNTAANVNNKMRIDFDYYNFVVDCNLATETFSVTNSLSRYWDDADPYEADITLTNGKITRGVVEMPSGTRKQDKIEMTIELGELKYAPTGTVVLPAETVTIVGYRRTGFLEDENFVYKGN
ncbi:MAG: hypothetical protein FWG79_02765 [Bacteroidales bacterium]|nr:hypothetical protein [Bacteroidales bacterium]